MYHRRTHGVRPDPRGDASRLTDFPAAPRESASAEWALLWRSNRSRLRRINSSPNSYLPVRAHVVERDTSETGDRVPVRARRGQNAPPYGRPAWSHVLPSSGPPGRAHSAGLETYRSRPFLLLDTKPLSLTFCSASVRVASPSARRVGFSRPSWSGESHCCPRESS